MTKRERERAHALLVVKGAKANYATRKGQPGKDIEELREEQKKMRWDSETVRKAMNRYYPTRAHAKYEIAEAPPSG